MTSYDNIPYVRVLIITRVGKLGSVSSDLVRAFITHILRKTIKRDGKSVYTNVNNITPKYQNVRRDTANCNSQVLWGDAYGETSFKAFKGEKSIK